MELATGRSRAPVRECGADSPAGARSPGCTIAAYARAKALPEAFLQTVGVSEIRHQGVPALRIALSRRRRRRAWNPLQARDREEPHQGRPLPLGDGLEALPLWTVAPAAGATVVIVEGESDCHTLWHHGINAVGVPGASNWKDERDAPPLGRIRDHLRRRRAGPWRRYRAAMGRHTPSSRIGSASCGLSGFKDPSEMHVADPEAVRARWDAAVAAGQYHSRHRRAKRGRTATPLRRETRSRPMPFLSALLASSRRRGAGHPRQGAGADRDMCSVGARGSDAGRAGACRHSAPDRTDTTDLRAISSRSQARANARPRPTARRSGRFPATSRTFANATKQNCRAISTPKMPGRSSGSRSLGNKRQYPDPAAKRAALMSSVGLRSVLFIRMLVCPEPTFEGLERLFAVGQPSMGVFSGKVANSSAGTACRRKRSSAPLPLSPVSGMARRSGACERLTARRCSRVAGSRSISWSSPMSPTFCSATASSLTRACSRACS